MSVVKPLFFKDADHNMSECSMGSDRPSQQGRKFPIIIADGHINTSLARRLRIKAHKRFLTPFVALIALLFSTIIHAVAVGGAPVAVKGYVYSRSVVISENGNPYWAGFDATGSKVESLGEATGDKDPNNIFVLGGQTYRDTTALWQQNVLQYPGAEVLSRARFFLRSFATVSGGTVTPVASSCVGAVAGGACLQANTQFVLVRPANQIVGNEYRYILNNPADIILMEAPFDFSKALDDDIRSLLIKRSDGDILVSSQNNIGFETAFFGDRDEYDPNAYNVRDREDPIWGPISGVEVESLMSKGISNSEGEYSVYVETFPCDVVATQMWNMTATLYSANFNPRRSSRYPYFMMKQYSPPCYSQFWLGHSIFGAAYSFPNDYYIPDKKYMDFPIDLMVLNGYAKMESSVSVSAEPTTYSESGVALPKQVNSEYDFDGDGTFDTAILGRLINNPVANTLPEKLFTNVTTDVDDKDLVQGVYLSSIGNSYTDAYGAQPDLIRTADYQHNLQNEGLATNVNIQDLANTDLYLFRVSTGEIIAERSGLSQAEVEKIQEIGVDETRGQFYYSMSIRGPREGIYRNTSRSLTGRFDENGNAQSWDESFKRWQTYSGMRPELHERASDHLRPGELVRIIAINRATGYIGSASTVLVNSTNTSASGTQLSVQLPDIVMQPPNIKVWAERHYKIQQGLTKNEERTYAIGNEGAAMQDDQWVAIHTEWLDAGGNTLPSGLGDFGFTGRVGKITGADIVSDTGGSLSHFAIKPGKQLQVIRVSGTDITDEHLYVQVSGEPKERLADFSSATRATGAPSGPDFTSSEVHAGKLKHRPDRYVPIKVPVWNESLSLAREHAYTAAVNANPGAAITQPEPHYDWLYRPEFQFSTYSLEVQSIAESSTGSTTGDSAFGANQLELSDPKIDPDTDILELLYSLQQQDLAPLDNFGGDRELVFAVGETELNLTIGADQTLRFENLEHLESVSYDDLLTLRLYQNNDAANVLWQWQYAIESPAPINVNQTYSLANFETLTPQGQLYEITDGFGVLQIDLESTANVRVDLLDENKNQHAVLIPAEQRAAGNHVFVVLPGDLNGILPREGIDYYLRVVTAPTNGARGSEKLHEGHLINRVNGDMLGQIIQHDTLIQRGSLTLRREDLAHVGGGPQLSFIRSYSNETKTENEENVLGQGWSHNHNIFLKIIAYSDGKPAYGNNLPGWVESTRNAVGDKPRLLSAAEYAGLRQSSEYPTVVSVSNGGLFKRRDIGSPWVPQRGNHGELTTEIVANQSVWQFRSKDGTAYQFEPVAHRENTFYVHKIIDRNGNQLQYQYQNMDSKRLVSKVVDQAGRELNFEYGRADNSNARLIEVASSEGAELSFEYFDRGDPDYDPRVGALKTFRRHDFVEHYDYALENGDDTLNMASTTDANNQMTRYEYLSREQVGTQILSYAPGLNLHDLVYRVQYPGTANDTHFVEFEYDVADANIRRVTDLRGNTTEYVLNDFGNPTTITEPLGKVTSFKWSLDLGEPDNVMREKTDESIDATWVYTYDQKGNLATEIDPFGATTSITYDLNFSIPIYQRDKNGVELRYELDSRGNIEKEIQQATVNGALTRVETEHQYRDVNGIKGLRHKTINGREHATDYDYDEYGNLNRITEPEGTVTRYLNDSRGRRLSEFDGLDNETVYEYDELDRVVLVRDAEGNTVSTEYDAKGNKTLELHTDTYSIDGVAYQRTTSLRYHYDERDRVSKIERTGNVNDDAEYAIDGVKVFTYDANSNLLSESDWKQVASTHTYDELNRRLTTVDRIGSDMSYAYEFITGADGGLHKKTTDYLGRVSEQEFDKLGRLTRVIHPQVTDVDGVSTQYERVFTYDKLANITSITDENQHTTDYEYDGRYLKIRQTNALEKNAIWEYDEVGNVSKTIDEEGRETQFVYDKQNRLLEKRLPENHTWAYTYYANSTLETETDPWGFRFEYTYNKINQRTQIQNPDGSQERESYTSDGERVFHVDNEGRSTSRILGPENRVYQITDARGRSTRQRFDANNNVVESTLAWSASATGPTSVSSQYQYDALDRLSIFTEGAGSDVERQVEYRYDAQSNRTAEIHPQGRERHIAFDAFNRPMKVTTAAVDDVPAGEHPATETHTHYDGIGNVLKITDRRGNTTSTVYDVLNRPESITDALGQTVSYSYDGVGNIRFITDKRGHTREKIYDGLNRVIEEYVDDNNGTRFRLLAHEYDIDIDSGGHTNAVIDANNHRVESNLDWRGNVLTTALPSGDGYAAAITSQTYDTSGFMISSQDAENYTTVFRYFADGSVASVTNAANETTSYQYDLFGNQVEVSKPKGADYRQISRFDARNRLVEVENAEGALTRFEYDINSNLRHQYLPAANDSGDTHVEYSYDVLNRKREHIQHKDGGNLVTRYVYDAEGNLLTLTDAKGMAFSSTYDALNRLDTQTFPANDDIARIVTTYDANSNVDTITETKSSGDEVTDFDYDLLDRLLRRAQRGHIVSYAYDNNGNRTAVSAPGGNTTYQFDSRNRLSVVTAGSSAAATTYRYRQNNWLVNVQHANDTAAAYTHDDVGRVSSITNTLTGDTLLSRFEYRYDANGNRTEQIETQTALTSRPVLTTAYRYDILDRLSGYTETATQSDSEGNTTDYTKDHSFTYFPSYDRRTEQVTENGEAIQNRSYTYDQTYWLLGITETAASAGEIAYVYDANGNTLSKTDSTGEGPASTIFSYNARNQLKSVSSGAVGAESGQGTHDYNYAGMRIRHLGSERGDIEYIYDDDSIIDEVVNGSSTPVAHYRYGDRLLSLTPGAESSEQFYHYATLGTTANLTDASGASTVAYRTDPFGAITEQAGSSVNRQVFTGQEIDEKTGLIYFGARFYDPDTARFINQDSYLGESNTPPSLHRYLYAYSNPTVYWDENGHCSSSMAARGECWIPSPSQRQKDYLAKDRARAAEAGREIYSFVDDSVFNAWSTANESKNLGEFTGKMGDKFDSWAQETAKENAVERFAEGACTALRHCRTIGKRLGKATDKVVKSLDEAKDKLKKKLTGEKDPGLAAGPQQPKNKSESASSNCSCGPRCFVAGTLISTKDGLKRIEEIQLGDLVAARDENNPGGEISWKPVTELFFNDDDRTTNLVILEDEAGAQEVYEVTDNHPFFIKGKGWVDVDYLEPGMQVLSSSGGILTIIEIEVQNSSPVTYNIEVDGFHTYFVGELGAWVHNQNNPHCNCSASREEKLEAIRAGGTADVGPHKVGQYKTVKGHHPHQQAARANNENYNPKTALSMEDSKTSPSFNHKQVSKTQVKENAKLRKQQQTQSLADEEAVQRRAMKDGGVSGEDTEEILDLSRELLKDQNALDPTRVPGQRKGK